MRNIHKGVVRAADAYFKSDPSEGTREAQVAKKQLFADVVSRCYGAGRITVVDAGVSRSKGIPDEGIVLLSEKATNLGFFRAVREAVEGDRADTYARSLYRTVRPELADRFGI